MTGKTQIDLIHGHGWPAYLSSIASHTFVFGAAGPAIGAIASPGVVIYPIAFLAAYYVSFFAAVTAGAAVGMVSPFIRAAWLYPIAAIIGAACGGLIPFGFMPGMEQYAGMLVFYAFAGGVAALACTRMTRWVRRRFAT